MKKSSTRISANEMNRFMYCPNQWYYKRTYGTKVLGEMYQALDMEHSDHQDHFTKGMKHHSRYHLKYKVFKGIRLVLLGIIFLLILKGVGVL
ncbi:MAG: hypothetical protein RR448_09040 [Niameybacter sp.]|uniref:hypothetical protein n=1 Tax=Niameybacter sp. TaxID=2033640 RepID=UPI002FC84850